MRKWYLISIGIALLIADSVLIYCFKGSTATLILSPILATAIGALIIYLLTGVDAYIKTESEKTFDEGKELYNKKDHPKAIQIWRPLAEKNYAPAQFYLGEMYEYGFGVVKDKKQAFYWYEKGAKKGHASSQARLGYLYSSDNKYKEAKKWYEKAAKKGNVEGQNNLGYVYRIKEEYEDAFKWYKKAAEQGHPAAQSNVGYMYSKGLVDGKENPEVAAKWYRQSARQGDETGQYNLGCLYQVGRGVKLNKVHAYKWFYIANKNSSEYAKKELKDVKKKMTPKQIKDAEALAKKCIESNYEDCGDPQE